MFDNGETIVKHNADTSVAARVVPYLTQSTEKNDPLPFSHQQGSRTLRWRLERSIPLTPFSQAMFFLSTLFVMICRITGLFNFNPKWSEHSNNVDRDTTASFGRSNNLFIVSCGSHLHINTHLMETMSQMSSAYNLLSVWFFLPLLDLGCGFVANESVESINTLFCPYEQIRLHSGVSLHLYFVTLLHHTVRARQTHWSNSRPTPQIEVASKQCRGLVCHTVATSSR